MNTMDLWVGGEPVMFDAFDGTMSLFVQGAPYVFAEAGEVAGALIVNVIERVSRRIQLVPV